MLFSLLRGLGGKEPLKALQGELGVHRDGHPLEEDGRIHPFSAFEGVLEGKPLFGEYLGEELGEQPFPQAPAGLGRPEDVLEGGDVLGELSDAPAGLLQGPELFLHVGHHPLDPGKALSQRPLLPLEELGGGGKLLSHLIRQAGKLDGK